MKYCIGCALLNFNAGESGYSLSEVTYEPTRDPSFACAKGHWGKVLDEDTGVTDIERAMQLADTCVDYVQRT